MGRPKLLLPFGNGTVLDRALAACAGLPVVLVTSGAVAAAIAPVESLRIVVNDEPERGMTHSLRLADAAFDPAHSLLVVPADLPFLGADLVKRVAAASSADVAYPICGARPAHPVRFSPAARALLAGLPEGDTLRALRDHPALSRTIAGEAEARSQVDIDDPAAYDGALAQLREA
jgi:nicotine blue oxidoreductase